MTRVPSYRPPGLLAAIRSAGGLNALARMLGIKGASISGWVHVPAERVLQIEALTEFSPHGQATRYEMRPDLYPRDDPNDPDKKGFMPELTKHQEELEEKKIRLMGKNIEPHSFVDTLMGKPRVRRASD